MTAPLSGITMLDLTHVLAGPFCATTLADLGARVIKVERPVTGDDTRAFPPFVQGESAYFAALNAGKQSIALDLKSPPDRAIFERLLARADVILENYRPGVMERLGYGWEALHARHPRLIYGAVSGFGHTGPDAAKPAYDMVVQARGGVMSITKPGPESLVDPPPEWPKVTCAVWFPSGGRLLPGMLTDHLPSLPMVVVPVLPNSGSPRSRRVVAVPLATTPSSMWTT